MTHRIRELATVSGKAVKVDPSRWLALILLTIAATIVESGEIVRQKGVASPQDESEVGNIELLRQRAIRNALDLAVLQVSGATISGQRSGSLRSRDETTISDGTARMQTREQSSYQSASLSRSTGYTRMIELVREWKEGEQYFVELRAEVGTEADVAKRENAGFYWARAGKPRVCMTMLESTNGEETASRNSYTLSYLRDNLIRNGITLTDASSPECAYQVEVIQEHTIQEMAGYGTLTANCRLSYQISNTPSNSVLAEHRATHGPSAGFDEQQAKTECIKAIAPQISEQLVRGVAGIMNDKWSEGSEYRIIIERLPGGLAMRARETIENLFRVKVLAMESYSDGAISLRVEYAGNAADLAEAIASAFEFQDTALIPKEIQGNELSFEIQAN